MLIVAFPIYRMTQLAITPSAPLGLRLVENKAHRSHLFNAIRRRSRPNTHTSLPRVARLRQRYHEAHQAWRRSHSFDDLGRFGSIIASSHQSFVFASIQTQAAVYGILHTQGHISRLSTTMLSAALKKICTQSRSWGMPLWCSSSGCFSLLLTTVCSKYPLFPHPPHARPGEPQASPTRRLLTSSLCHIIVHCASSQHGRILSPLGFTRRLESSGHC